MSDDKKHPWLELPESKIYGVDRCDKCGCKAEANGLCSDHLKLWLDWMNKKND